MQQDNNIKNKLQQLDNQQLPDLSHMDEHWQQMQQMLPAATSTGGKIININRWVWIVSGSLIIIAGLFLLNHLTNKNEKQSSASATITPAVIITATNKMVSPPIVTSIDKPAQPKATIIKNAKKAKQSKDQNPVDKSIPLQLKVDTKDSTIQAVQPDKQALLNDLLGKLEKKSQEFIIDNSKDTLLTGEEGSSLLIPANSLGGNKEVKISLREFYKTSDIILNRLSTTSNGNQLATGGMVQITATVKGQPVNIQPNNPIRLYLPDTNSVKMQQMQLFTGDVQTKKEVKNPMKVINGERDSSMNYSAPGQEGTNNTMQINWSPGNQYFQQQTLVRKVKVFNVSDDPFKVEETAKGSIAYFKKSGDSKFTRKQLADMLKAKYGYYKVRVRNSWNAGYMTLTGKYYPSDESAFFENGIGDTVWTTPTTAKNYKLVILDTMCYWAKSKTPSYSSGINNMLGYYQNNKNDINNKQAIFKQLESKYYIDINSLGWINCDHFLDRPKLVEYAVNLNDTAVNYYTMLVFSNINSMMTGYLSGDKVIFSNVPEGEAVKIISIGINKNGHPIMAIKETTIARNEASGLQFEEVVAADIKSSLCKMDN